MSHPFLTLFGLFAAYRFLGTCQKSLESTSSSLQKLSNDMNNQITNSYISDSKLVIDLKFDDEVLKDVAVNGGTVTRIERNGDDTVVHIDWKL